MASSPKYRADQIGSLLRPAAVLKGRAALEKGAIAEEELKAIEDEAITEVVRMQEEVGKIPGMKMSFTQPIEMRMNELVEGMGVRAEVGIKVFGPDMDVLRQKADQIGKRG